MNCKLEDFEHGETPQGKPMIRRGLVLESNVLSGATIFTEDPLISTLFPDVEVRIPKIKLSRLLDVTAHAACR
jgi:import receptor subunit TOM20